MKRFFPLTLLAAALVSQPALAEKVTVCHKARETISIAARALPAHIAHGDTEGACPTVEPPVPTPFAALVLRCDSEAGGVAVISASVSDEPLPVTLPVAGDNCAAAVAGLLNQGWQLRFVTSGTAAAPLEGESGFVTEYTFVSGGPAEDDEDSDD